MGLRASFVSAWRIVSHPSTGRMSNIAYTSATCSSANKLLHYGHSVSSSSFSSSSSSFSSPAWPRPEEEGPAVKLTIDDQGFAEVLLNRGDTFNTLSDTVVEEYTQVVDTLEASTVDIRGVFVKATGKLFCAGANLKWMLKTAQYTEEQNQADAQALGNMLNRFNNMP